MIFMLLLLFVTAVIATYGVFMCLLVLTRIEGSADKLSDQLVENFERAWTRLDVISDRLAGLRR